jgi:uncharacterized OB-fold protein
MLEAPLSYVELTASALTRPFWDACRQGRLTFQCCSDCGKAFFRPEIACPHCLSPRWTWETSAGLGALYSFSISHRAPTPAFKAPFIFAAVDLDEGWTMFSNLIGLETDDARIGMRLRAVFHPVTDGVTLPLFEPA